MTNDVVIDGWRIFFHPLFLEQYSRLIAEAEKARRSGPDVYRSSRQAKMLAAVQKLVFEVVPRDPAAPEFRLGNTLGPEHRHWRRAKFFQQYRLFFRYDSADRIIVFVWLNDENTKRAYGSKTDAYAVFRKMVERGNPPDDLKKLMRAVRPAAR